MIRIGFAIFLLGLIPIQIASTPAPIAIAAFSTPVSAMLIGFRKSRSFFVAMFALTVSFLIASLNSLFSADMFPILSFLSFFIPISGLFVGLARYRLPKGLSDILRYFWIANVLFALALAINLYSSRFQVRVAISSWSDFYGNFMALTVDGTIFGADMFAAFGVNSFAGIVLSFLFLSALRLPSAARRERSVLLLSMSVFAVFGILLFSRMFTLGLMVFIFSLLFNSRAKLSQRIAIFTVGLAVATAILVFDERFVWTIDALWNSSSGAIDWSVLSSNRNSILSEIPDLTSLILGNAFGEILGENQASNSFHLYALTAAAKGGLLVAAPLLWLIFGSLAHFRKIGRARRTEDVIINAAVLSFVAQSFVWDIFAVQILGHIAWFFVGLGLAGNRGLSVARVFGGGDQAGTAADDHEPSDDSLPHAAASLC